jgi:hypothetical protein
MTAPRCCGRLRPDPLARARQCLLLLHGGFAAAQAGPPLSLCVCLLSPEAAAEGEDQLLAAGLQVMTQAGMFCPCISRIKLAPEEEMGERKVEAWDTFQAAARCLAPPPPTSLLRLLRRPRVLQRLLVPPS